MHYADLFHTLVSHHSISFCPSFLWGSYSFHEVSDIQLIHNVSSWITLNCILSKFETKHNNLESSSDIAISISPCTPTSYFTYQQPTRHLAIQSRWISTTLFTFTSILLVLWYLLWLTRWKESILFSFSVYSSPIIHNIHSNLLSFNKQY